MDRNGARVIPWQRQFRQFTSPVHPPFAKIKKNCIFLQTPPFIFHCSWIIPQMTVFIRFVPPPPLQTTVLSDASPKMVPIHDDIVHGARTVSKHGGRLSPVHYLSLSRSPKNALRFYIEKYRSYWLYDYASVGVLVHLIWCVPLRFPLGRSAPVHFTLNSARGRISSCRVLLRTWSNKNDVVTNYLHFLLK